MNSKFTFWTLMMTMFFIMSCSKEENQGGETPSNKNIPQVVLNEFSERYPNATNVVWTKKYDTYDIRFDAILVEYPFKVRHLRNAWVASKLF